LVSVLGTDLFCGLIGIALHVWWVVAVTVMAIGVGHVFANGRQERIRTLHRQQRTPIPPNE
jgi:hypothetical protein